MKEKKINHYFHIKRENGKNNLGGVLWLGNQNGIVRYLIRNFCVNLWRRPQSCVSFYSEKKIFFYLCRSINLQKNALQFLILFSLMRSIVGWFKERKKEQSLNRNIELTLLWFMRYTFTLWQSRASSIKTLFLKFQKNHGFILI